MAFVTYQPDPMDVLAADLHYGLVDEAGAECDVCGATWNPFDLADEQAAGNEALWHSCMTEA